MIPDDFSPIKWINEKVELIDQSLLPFEEKWIHISNYTQMINAIKTMRIRGAPAIGIAGAYGLALGAIELYKNNKPKSTESFYKQLNLISIKLVKSRPTGSNLKWAIDRMLKVAKKIEKTVLIHESLIKEAKIIHSEDIESNYSIGELGASLLNHNTRILTHCNAGALATGGYGTALGVIKSANHQGKISKVYSTETRPLLQGSRLTIWELINSNIDAYSIPDSAAGHLMQKKEIDTIIVGADRITSNGDVANKIGTYTLAILAKANNIAFYVAAPTSTIDMKLTDGSQIPIEERGREEVASINNMKIIQDHIKIYNPAFDVTPNKLITSIITEKGIIYPPYNLNINKIFGGKDA